jgi:hypothetical protein
LHATLAFPPSAPALNRKLHGGFVRRTFDRRKKNPTTRTPLTRALAPLDPQSLSSSQ